MTTGQNFSDAVPEAEFRLGTFQTDQSPFAGLVRSDGVVRLDDLMGHTTVRGLLDSWSTSLHTLRKLAARDDLEVLPASSVAVLPPIFPPGAFVCMGANYGRHVVQMTVARMVSAGTPHTEALIAAERIVDDRSKSGIPFAFPGFPGAICGAHDDIMLPNDGSVEHDWELELAVVIGAPARNVRRSDAMDYVAGYTITNDISTRDRMIRSDVPLTDFISTKLRPTFKPTGPFITPAEFVRDPASLSVTLKVNGEMMQEESTADMIFGVDRVIEYLSGITLLSPGDLILTGSPAGNAAHHGGRFLQPGDEIDGEISGLGCHRNRCMLDPDPAYGPPTESAFRPVVDA